MTWIDDRLKQRSDLTRRNTVVAEGAEEIFNELWKAVFAVVTEAKAKGLDIGTNGKSFERVVWRAEPPSVRPQQPINLVISLDKDQEEISASGPGQKINLSIDVCDDWVVCLKHDGKPLLIQDAARLILDPFLFPELQALKQGSPL